MLKTILSAAIALVVLSAPAFAQSSTSGAMSGSQSGVYDNSTNINIPSKSLRTVGTAIAPSIAAAGIDNCAGSVSGGIGLMGVGLSGGSTYTMQPCNIRAMARLLDSMGQRGAAIHYLAANDEALKASLAAVGAVVLTGPQQARSVPASAQYANSRPAPKPLPGKPPFCANPQTYNASLCN